MLRSTSFVLSFGLTLLGSALPASRASAQVFNSGPSDPALFSTVINLPPDPNIGDFESIADGTQLNVADGGSVGVDFQAGFGSEVNISGGAVGDVFQASGSEVNFSGGTVEGGIRASGSEVNISGGSVELIFASSSSKVNVSGGAVEGTIAAFSDSEVNFSGGTAVQVTAGSGVVVNISGGTVDFLNPGGSSTVVNISGGEVLAGFGDGTMNISGGAVKNIRAFDGINVNLFGTEFSLNGTPIASLVPNQAFVVSLSDAEGLTGTLNDGTAFAFNEFAGFDFFRSDSTVTVTLAAPLLLGDITRDGLVNFLDISPFIVLLSGGEYQDEADIDGNGVVNFLDIAPFITILSAQ